MHLTDALHFDDDYRHRQNAARCSSINGNAAIGERMKSASVKRGTTNDKTNPQRLKMQTNKKSTSDLKNKVAKAASAGGSITFSQCLTGVTGSCQLSECLCY